MSQRILPTVYTGNRHQFGWYTTTVGGCAAARRLRSSSRQAFLCDGVRVCQRAREECTPGQKLLEIGNPGCESLLNRRGTPAGDY